MTMRSRFDHLPGPVARALRAYWRRKQQRAFAQILLGCGIVYLGLVLVSVHLDRFLFLSGTTRASLFWMVHGLTAALAAGLLIGRITLRPSVRRLAYELEGLIGPEAQERFVTLDSILSHAEEGRSQTGRAFLNHLRVQAAARAEGLQAARLATGAWMRRLALGACGLGLVYGVLAAPAVYQFPLMLKRFYRPRAELPKPSFVRLEAVPGEQIVPKGGEAVLQVRVLRRMPRPLAWVYRRLGASPEHCLAELRRDVPGQTSRVPMARVNRDLYVLSQSRLQSSFTAAVRCGDAEARAVVLVVEQPRILDFQLVVTPPGYVRRPARTLTEFPEPLRLLPGTNVRIGFGCDQDLASSEIVFAKPLGPVAPQWDPDTRKASYEFTFKSRTEFEVVVRNRQGFANRERLKVALELLTDAEPVVRLERPGPEVDALAGELVPFTAEVSDDFGLKEATLRYVVNPSPESETAPQDLPVALEGELPVAVRVSPVLDLATLGVVPGDVVVVQLTARDAGGNDGASYPVTIRVAAFSRDENERLRLRSLRFLQAALSALAADPAAGAEEALELSPTVRAKTMALAKEAGLVLPSEPGLRDLLSLLEVEHHLTDAPQHKDDLRMLRAVLLAAAVPLHRGADAGGRRRIEEVSGALLPALTRFRTLKNLTWRLYALRTESERIAVQMRPQPGAERRNGIDEESLRRRTKLYLTALQDAGAELLAVVRETHGSDAAGLAGLIGDLNTAGWQMQRGAVARRLASCEDVRTLIGRVLAATAELYGDALSAETAARRRLEALYAAQLGEVVRSIAASAGSDGWAERAAARLADDRRLLDYNPFAPLWPRIRDAALLAVLSSLGEQPAPAVEGVDAARRVAQAALVPPSAVAQAADRERLAWTRMGFEAANARVLAIEGVPVEEKALQLELNRAEYASLAGASFSLPSMPPAAMSEEALAERSRLVSPAPFTVADFATLATTAAEWGLRRPAAETMSTLIARMRRETEKIDEAIAGLRRRSDVSAGDVRVLHAQFEREVGRVRDAVSTLQLAACLDVDTAAGADADWRLVELRQALGRYRINIAQPMAAIDQRGSAALTPGEMTQIHIALDRIRNARGTMVDVLAKAAAEPPPDPVAQTARRARYSALDFCDRTRDYESVLRGLLTGQGGPASAQDIVGRYPEAGLGYLGARAPEAAKVRLALGRIEVALRKAVPDAASLRAEVGDARSRLTTIADAAARAGKAEPAVRTLHSAEALLKALGDIALPDGAVLDTAGATRRLLALGGLERGTEALHRELVAAGETAALGLPAFAGAPEVALRPELRLALEHAAARTAQQVRLARTDVVAGVLEALSAQPARDRYLSSWQWSLMLQSIARSPLSAGAGVRLAAGAAERESDPHRRFLSEELDKARKTRVAGPYAGAIKEYLDSVADLLKY